MIHDHINHIKKYKINNNQSHINILKNKLNKHLKKSALLLSLLAALPLYLAQIGIAEITQKPNILIIVADDMGYSDLAPFGGEIPTPNLQQLADQGVRMNQFYTSPMSAPARSMLMTGNSNQQAGMGAMVWYENTLGADGYEMRLSNRIVTMPERFKDAGYATMMGG